MLVTGAGGFTASYVIPALAAAGFEVWTIARGNTVGARELRADINDPAGMHQAVATAAPTHVVHLAGTSNLPDSEASTLFAVNAEGTRNLLNACARLATSPKRILLASSGYVYGDTGGGPADEDRVPTPVGAYGKSKLEMEAIAKRYSDQLGITIVRPFNYTGVGQDEKFIIPKLVAVFRERRHDVSFVDPRAVRDFSDVRWVADVYVRLLHFGTSPDVVNVCSGTGRSLLEVLDCLERLTGHRPDRTRLGQRDAVPSNARLVGSNRRLMDMGIAAAPYSLEQTLSWMLGDAR